jgi:hypothetical protein
MSDKWGIWLFCQLRQESVVQLQPVRSTRSHTSYKQPLISHLKPTSADPEQADIVDETLDLFRANSLFRNFEIKGPADRLLIILILFISDCLAKLGNAKTVPTQIEASKMLNTLSVDNFPVPGDANFPLNAHYAAAASRADSGKDTI